MPKVTQTKHYPQADNWMWNYCQYLGSVLDVDGRPYDLGVWTSSDKIQISFAIVDGPIGGDYHSGSIYVDGVIQSHIFSWLKNSKLIPHQVAFKLAQQKGVFKNTLHHVDLEKINQYHTDIYKYMRDVVISDKECIAVSKTGEQKKVICSRDMSVDFTMAVYVFDAETFEEVDTRSIYYFIG